MQKTFDDPLKYPSFGVDIIGINEVDRDSNNLGFVDGRDIPWLQDVDADANGISDVWYDSWDIEYRDVVVVDQDNNEVMRYNLTTNDLADPANYQTLFDMFTSQAPPPETAWQQAVEKLDVDSSGEIAARDAGVIINALARDDYPGGDLPAGVDPPFYYDTTGSNTIEGQDVLLVINQLITANATAAAPQAPLSADASAEASVDSVFDAQTPIRQQESAQQRLPDEKIVEPQEDRTPSANALVAYELTEVASEQPSHARKIADSGVVDAVFADRFALR